MKSRDLFNPHVGSSFRTRTYFHQRLARFADVFTSNVCNLLHYPVGKRSTIIRFFTRTLIFFVFASRRYLAWLNRLSSSYGIGTRACSRTAWTQCPVDESCAIEHAALRSTGHESIDEISRESKRAFYSWSTHRPRRKQISNCQSVRITLVVHGERIRGQLVNVDRQCRTLRRKSDGHRIELIANIVVKHVRKIESLFAGWSANLGKSIVGIMTVVLGQIDCGNIDFYQREHTKAVLHMQKDGDYFEGWCRWQQISSRDDEQRYNFVFLRWMTSASVARSKSSTADISNILLIRFQFNCASLPLCLFSALDEKYSKGIWRWWSYVVPSIVAATGLKCIQRIDVLSRELASLSVRKMRATHCRWTGLAHEAKDSSRSLANFRLLSTGSACMRPWRRSSVEAVSLLEQSIIILEDGRKRDDAPAADRLNFISIFDQLVSRAKVALSVRSVGGTDKSHRSRLNTDTFLLESSALTAEWFTSSYFQTV